MVDADDCRVGTWLLYSSICCIFCTRIARSINFIHCYSEEAQSKYNSIMAEIGEIVS